MGGGNSFLGGTDFREARRKFEIAYLKRKLEEHGWNVSQTAAEVGLQRQSLPRKPRELGINTFRPIFFKARVIAGTLA